MKPNLTLSKIHIACYLFALIVLLLPNASLAQVCSDPAGVIYGLTGNGAIYPINVSNGSTGSVIKNTSYPGNSVSKANGLAYSSTSGKFFYFKRNVGASPQEFVSYDVGSATVTVLGSSTCNSEVHTGCITADGLYYYTIDIDANLNRYDIINNIWTKITSTFTDQFGNDVSSVIKDQNAGDIAFDGNGNLWIITSSSSNFGVYMLPAPMPSTVVASVTVNQRVDPTTSTPSGNMIAGIAFNPTGQIFMSTKNDNRLYRLENNLSLTLLGTFPVSDVGNDLTSCAFPLGVLPVTWTSFDATLLNRDKVSLNWSIAEKNNTGFAIQHSLDGKNWKDISFIEPVPGNMEIQAYSFVHADPAAGKNYYRLASAEISGKLNYSVVKMVMVSEPGIPVKLWPNPVVGGSVQIRTENTTGIKVSIYDLAGQLQLSKWMQPGEAKIATHTLARGTYLLTVVTQQGNIRNQKLIIQ